MAYTYFDKKPIEPGMRISVMRGSGKSVRCNSRGSWFAHIWYDNVATAPTYQQPVMRHDKKPGTLRALIQNYQEEGQKRRCDRRYVDYLIVLKVASSGKTFLAKAVFKNTTDSMLPWLIRGGKAEPTDVTPTITSELIAVAQFRFRRLLWLKQRGESLRSSRDFARGHGCILEPVPQMPARHAISDLQYNGGGSLCDCPYWQHEMNQEQWSNRGT